MKAEIMAPANGWEVKPLEQVADILDSMRIPVNNSERAARIAGKGESELYPYYGATGQVGVIDGHLFDGEYVLLGEDGAPFLDPIKNKAYLATGKFWVNNHAHILRAKGSNKFLCHYLNHISYEGHVTGTTRLKLTQGALKKIPVMLPSEEVQKDIVAKIETLFSELDKGIESLKTARQQLKAYRQAVLKHAFEGKLTEQWRQQNPDKLESPEQLLVRIQHEREQRYQQQLKDWKQAVKTWEDNGKAGKKPGKPIKPKQFASLTKEENTKLGNLPTGWKWVRIGEIASVGTGVTPLKSNTAFYTGGNIPWVTSGALNDAFVREPSGYVTDRALNETNLRLFPVNTLVVALYGEGKTRGKCSELMIEATTNQAIAGIIQEGISAEIRRFLKWFLLKNYEAIRMGSSGGVQPNLNLGIIEATAFPLCSVSEAREIATSLDVELSRIEKLDAEIEIQMDKAEVLRQSILKKAFSGQLASTNSIEAQKETA